MNGSGTMAESGRLRTQARSGHRRRGGRPLAGGAGLVLVLLCAGTTAGRAQEPGPGPARDAATRRWTARLTYTHDSFADDGAAWLAWRTVEGQAGYRFDSGAAALIAASVERFGRHAGQLGVDLYRTLGPRRYGNLRIVGASGGEVVPALDAAVELYQGLVGGWEPSLGHRVMRYEAGTAHLTSAGLGRYVGERWYGRVRGTYAGGIGGGGGSAQAAVRRYHGRPSDFVELGASGGREVASVVESGTPGAVARGSWSVTLATQRYVGARTGITAGLGYGRFEGQPARLTVSGGLLARW